MCCSHSRRSSAMNTFTRLVASTACAGALFSTDTPVAGRLQASGVPAASAQQAPAPARTALRGATVIDVVAGTAVPDAVIVIEGDKITAFGGRDAPIPADAAVVDLSGKFVIPGLFDSHVHYQPFLGELYLNFGVTSAMALGARAPIGEQYWRNSHGAEFRAPRLFGTGRLPLAGFINPTMTRDEVRAGVQE